MLVYVFKRLLAMIPTLLGITLITFLIINLAPGDPVATGFGQDGGGPSAEGGGGQNQDRLADAIKAKKKLLGMVAEDRSVNAWPLTGDVMELSERVGDFSGWGHALLRLGDGRVAVGTTEGEVLLVDPATGAVSATLSGHTSGVGALAVSPDGALLASGDGLGGVRTWALPDGAPTAELAPLGKPIGDLAFAGGTLLVAAHDGRIRAMDPATLRIQQTLSEHNGGVYALAVSADGSRFWSGGYDRALMEWSTADLTVQRTSDVHGGVITDLALSPDGRRLASASDDRKLRIIDLAAWDAEPLVLEGHYKSATTVAWSADGARLFSGSRDETVRRWDATTGEEKAMSAETPGRIYALAVVDGRLLSVGDTWKRVPVWKRYLKWLVRIVTFDFDRSFVDDRPVIDKIAEALPITLGLNVIAITIIYVVSIPLGVLAAVKRGSTFDHVSSVVLFILYSVPNFWLATLLIMFFSSKLQWDILPSVGLISDNADDLSYLQWLWDGALHMVLPITVMVYAGFASLSRYTRVSLLETIGADYVRTARAKGLSETVVVLKHAFRNSLITIVTLVANLLPALIGGSVIVEYIFSIDGMGKLGFDAILTRDYPVIMAITTFSAFLTLLGILVSDLLYSVVDPRVRAE
ncbi:MAG: ABC transporter permease subunit [Alphaproteobacteria bacterium]|nr:ABC transporter permease subunit [Alphaproteobacteria bacterium]